MSINQLISKIISKSNPTVADWTRALRYPAVHSEKHRIRLHTKAAAEPF